MKNRRRVVATIWRRADMGLVEPFILVVEGSIPNEKNKAEGYWAGLGTDPTTGWPIPHLPMDRSFGAAGLGRGW